MTGGPVPFDLAAVRDGLAAAGAGRLLPIGLRRVIDGDGALARLADAVGELARSGDRVVVLAAATPMGMFGGDLRSAIEAVLSARFQVKWVVVGPAAHGAGDLHADAQTVAAAAAATAGAGCVVTVGSGTITDIGKAATRAATPLIAVQTATSVNGYADPFSVLLRDGVKRTTPSRWPDTLLIDPDVLSAAPADLNRAGAGDLMAMFTASADWYLAAAIARHGGTAAGVRAAEAAGDSGRGGAARDGEGSAGGGEVADTGADPPYHPAVTGLSRAHGERLLTLAAALRGEPAARDADPGALADLARLLTLSGIGMGVAGSTAPASGMEHAISHLLEMAASARGEPGSFHGMQVGVASVVAAATWAHVRRAIAGGALDRPARLPDPDIARELITRSFAAVDPTGAMAAECFSDYAVKLRRLSAADPLAGLRESWAEHEAVLGTLLAGPAEVARALRLAGLPARFGELPEPVTDQSARWAVASCMLMRQRLSVADLAMLTGSWQDSDIDEVLAAASAATAQIPGGQIPGAQVPGGQSPGGQVPGDQAAWP